MARKGRGFRIPLKERIPQAERGLRKKDAGHPGALREERGAALRYGVLRGAYKRNLGGTAGFSVPLWMEKPFFLP